MKKPNSHLNIDLGFLDKQEPLRKSSKENSGTEKATSVSPPAPIKFKYKWVIILVVGYTIFFFLGGGDSTNNSTSTTASSYTSQNTTEDTVKNGEYMCSNYHSNQADLLDPSESEEQITSAQNLLEQRSDQLERLRNEIDNSYVNDSSSQYEIDDYNEKIDTYNAKLNSYKRDANNMSTRIDSYNEQINRHNNYLMAHCTKSY